MATVTTAKGQPATDFGSALSNEKAASVAPGIVSPNPNQADSAESFTPTAAELANNPGRLSVIMWDAMKPVHTEIGEYPATKKLLNAELSRAEYTRTLMMLWHVYNAMENGLEEHIDHPVINAIYSRRIFSRLEFLSDDITFFSNNPDWKNDPMYISLMADFPEPVQAYVSRLEQLGRPDASDKEVSMLASHMYVRYLGDMSGGQFMKRAAAKNYGLDKDGYAFYNFRTLDPATGERPAGLKEIKDIKQWFKDNLDNVVTDPEIKAAIIAEARAAFYYNLGLFSSIDITQTI